MAGNLKVAATIVEAVETEKRGERGDTAKEGKGRRKGRVGERRQMLASK